jgi:hypothetical protein
VGCGVLLREKCYGEGKEEAQEQKSVIIYTSRPFREHLSAFIMEKIDIHLYFEELMD